LAAWVRKARELEARVIRPKAYGAIELPSLVPDGALHVADETVRGAGLIHHVQVVATSIPRSRMIGA